MADGPSLPHVNPEIAAAQQLMQLSDEDNNVSISSSKRNIREDEQEVEQRVISDTTLAKIQEIFGKDEVYRPRKPRKYRSLVNIYMATTPIHEKAGFSAKESRKH